MSDEKPIEWGRNRLTVKYAVGDMDEASCDATEADLIAALRAMPPDDVQRILMHIAEDQNTSLPGVPDAPPDSGAEKLREAGGVFLLAPDNPGSAGGEKAERWVRCDAVLFERERCILRKGHREDHTLCGQPCPLLGDYCPQCGVNGAEPPTDEPPQPSPAVEKSQGGPGPDFVTRAELVAMLRRPISGGRAPSWFDAALDDLADELEQSTPGGKGRG